jgi:hypothetical protein
MANKRPCPYGSDSHRIVIENYRKLEKGIEVKADDPSTWSEDSYDPRLADAITEALVESCGSVDLKPVVFRAILEWKFSYD